tara:strand:+ start:786 stop:995 length:210 start_codon:yes stop_codon:yes gene_type:complete
MSTSRKTIDVKTVKTMANHFLAAKNTNDDERQAIASFIESILMESGNYKGFSYLETDEVLGAGTRRRYS